MSGTHSILSPSKAHMILRCVGALAAGKGCKDEPSEYAAEGTAYHLLASQVLERLLESCESHVGHIIEADGFKFTINEENAAHAQTYVDAIRRLPGQQFYEVRLDTSEVVGVPGQGGTADAITLDYDTGTIHVDDLKFGRGDIVHACDNEQLLTYGAAALLKFEMHGDWKFLKVAIHQPRVNHYSEMTYAVDKVWEWVMASRPRFMEAFRLYQEPPADLARHLTPTEKGCRWCPIRGSCSARTKKIMDMFPLTPQPARTVNLSDSEVVSALDRVDEIEQWCADIRKEAHARAMAGAQLQGWKLVQGRKGNRKWAETPEKTIENTLVQALGDGAYKPREILSPSDAEKKLKKSPLWTPLQTYITQAEGALSLEREEVSKAAVSRQPIEFPVVEVV